MVSGGSSTPKLLGPCASISSPIRHVPERGVRERGWLTVTHGHCFRGGKGAHPTSETPGQRGLDGLPSDSRFAHALCARELLQPFRFFQNLLKQRERDVEEANSSPALWGGGAQAHAPPCSPGIPSPS